MDFFISYNRDDRAWAETIAKWLEAAGYTTIIQSWDFRPGANFVLEMQRAATLATRTIAVLSPSYLTSRFGASEWATAFARDPTGEHRTLVPVRVRECDVEGLLGQIVYVDLVGLNEAESKAALLEGLAPGRTPARTTADRQVEQPSVLVDVAHGQDRWSEPLTEDRGLRRAAELAKGQGFTVTFQTSGPLVLAGLWQHRALILSIGPQGRGLLAADEVQAVRQFVQEGGGLLALSTYAGDWHHQANLNDVLNPFGLSFNRDLVMPETAVARAGRDDGRTQVYQHSPDSVFVVPARPADRSFADLVQGVRQLLTLSSCSIGVAGTARAVVSSVETSRLFDPRPLGAGYLIDRWEAGRRESADVVAASAGAGRVVAVGGFKMFLSEFLDHPGYDNARLFENCLRWLAATGQR